MADTRIRFRSGLVILAAATVLLAPGSAVAASVDVGQKAPALLVATLDGTAFDLNSLGGKVVVLNLWATWCTPCRAEMPMLDAFYRKHRGEGVMLLGLSADDLHDRRDVEALARRISYPAALLREAKVNGFGMPPALPETYVIDRNGVIRARFRPTRAGLSEPELAAAVMPLVAPSGAGQ